ncbi:NADH-quinone oxidoreductase subunit J [Natronospira proteinivora]|uniref:NADH-quinone oxidoreductase subunit J n=1 Tax=Natronospira proteinivora TaxID=1807133 RepID=A0ABT1G6P8_9GAMM|nr:NADH-quinone oxidoreductase subunit J [Natronospira proteinivora]MCP1726975.1 NADH-quinone oxidoreductase subunit J [Natronospira proteinivora]
MELVVFYVFAALVVGAAFGVILSRNPVHSVLFLIMSFVFSAGLWILLEAEFLGIALILVYVGAVMVLFLFVVMMLDINLASLKGSFARNAPLGAVVAAALVGMMVYVIWVRDLGIEMMERPERAPADYDNTGALGQLMYTEYVYPFEIAGMILLLGIVAAIGLTMRRREGTKHQDPAKQVQARREDRVRLVDMPTEKKD